MRHWLHALAIALALAGPADAGPKVGALHPPLRLPTVDGETFDLRSLLGKRVLLIQFASW